MHSGECDMLGYAVNRSGGSRHFELCAKPIAAILFSAAAFLFGAFLNAPVGGKLATMRFRGSHDEAGAM